MARSITFNAQTQFKPGAISKVDATGLTPVGTSAVGIVGIIGEADDGPPGEIVIVDDPATGKALYKSGPLADALRIAFDPSNDPRVPGGAFRVKCYKVNKSFEAGEAATSSSTFPTDATVLTGTSTGASTSAVITVTGGGLVADAHIGRWLLWDTTGERRRITDNTTTTITVSPAFSGAPADLDAISVLASAFTATSTRYGLNANQISIELEDGVATDTIVATISLGSEVEQTPEIGAKAYLELKFMGGPIAANGSGTIDACTTSTVTLNVGGAPVLNAWANYVIEFSDGKRRLITGNTAADPSVITLDAAHVLTTSQALDMVGTSATVRAVTAATATITGANGVATGLTSTVTMSPVSALDNLALTFEAGETLRQFIDRVNSTTNYAAEAGPGVNQDTTLMESFDFGTRATAVNVRFDDLIDYDSKGTFRRDLQDLIDYINDTSDLVTLERSTGATAEGAEMPLTTGGVSTSLRDYPVYLIGAARGTSTNSDWQDGFDAMMDERVNHVVPLIDQDLDEEGNGSTATFASVAAQLQAFVDEANAAGKNECGGYIGMNAGIDDVVAQAQVLNFTDVQIFPQALEVLDVTGTLTVMPYWSSAVCAAGMRSGVPEVGEPLTFKYIKTNSLTQNSDWSATNLTDVNKLIQNGVMFAEEVQGKGFRWVRDITTHLIDDNICYIDGHMRDAVRYVAYDLRSSLEDRFTGLKATPATVASMREFVGTKMGLYKEQNIITDSLDPETGTKVIPGFRNLRVFITGNVATIRVEIFVTAGVVFELLTIALQLPRLG
jgi:hypothetical protein